MASTFGARLRHAWNAFKRDPLDIQKSNFRDYGQSFLYRPDRLHLTRGPDKTIIASIYNRISMDAASIKMEHVRVDDDNRYLYTINSPLNNCLTVEANIDQSGRAFMQDAVLTMLDEGCVALVPTQTDIDPTRPDGPHFDILSMRTATIKQWYPKNVQVEIYNEETGQHSQYVLPKNMLAIVENPFYPVMNEPNSTMQRLIRKLTILDAIDEQTGSGKLDMIIQLPYVIKTEERRKQAENRRKDLEQQLSNSKYGVAYADGTEKIVQLNRPLENHLLSTIEYLTNMLYSQLGITTEVLNGSADEQTMKNYQNRIVEPILSAFADEMKRKFLTQTARTQHQSINFFIQPLRLVSSADLATLVDVLSRDEIIAPNEVRQVIGLKPSQDPTADELRNRNMPIEDQPQQMPMEEALVEEVPAEDEVFDPEAAMDAANDFDAQLDELEAILGTSDLKHYLPTPTTYASPYYDPEYAHEYYMKHRKLRKSTANLNEKGMEVATYVQAKIDEEKQQKLDEHSSRVDSSLKQLKSTRDESRSQNQKTADDRLRVAQKTRDTNLGQIDTNTSNRVDTINKNAKNETEQLRAEHETQLKQRQATIQNDIDALKRTLNSMSSTQKAKNRNKIQEQIDQLRNDNAEFKDQLASEYKVKISDVDDRRKQDVNTAKADQKSEKYDVREDYKSDAYDIREARKEAQRVITENYNTSVADLKAESKKEKQSIIDDYTEKWLTELDRIKSIPEYLKPEKTPKGSSQKKSQAKANADARTSRKPIMYTPSRSDNSRLKSIRSHSKNVRTTLNK